MLNKRLIARTRFRVVVSAASYSGDGVGYIHRHYGSRYLLNDGRPAAANIADAKRPIRDGENGSETKNSVTKRDHDCLVADSLLGFERLWCRGIRGRDAYALPKGSYPTSRHPIRIGTWPVRVSVMR